MNHYAQNHNILISFSFKLNQKENLSHNSSYGSDGTQMLYKVFNKFEVNLYQVT